MKTILRILYVIFQLCISLPIILVSTILTAIVTIIGGFLGNPDFWGYYPGMLWSRTICTSLLLPVHVKGKELIDQDKAYIIVANHQSAFDIFLIYGYLGKRFKWLMKKELAKIPLVGYACTKAGFIYIDRSSKVKSKESMDRAKQTLERGMSMVIFPEGTRSADGKTGRFKKGAFHLAEGLQLPVLPVTIDGSFKVMPRRAKLITWHPMTLTIHPAIDAISTEGLSESEIGEKINELTAKAEAAIKS